MRVSFTWERVAITIMACFMVCQLAFIFYLLLNKPEPVVKREIIERVLEVDKIIIADTIERGIASWYGEPEHGRRTASGEVYNMYEMTVAHPTLPFGTKLLVTNIKNGSSVMVTVTDRLPKVWTQKKYGRVIDMSYASALKLGMVRDGLVPVSLKTLKEYGGK